MNLREIASNFAEIFENVAAC
jgi:hypothetical protein